MAMEIGKILEKLHITSLDDLKPAERAT